MGRFFRNFPTKNLKLLLLFIIFFPFGFFKFANPAKLGHFLVQIFVEGLQLSREDCGGLEFIQGALNNVLSDFFSQNKNG